MADNGLIHDKDIRDPLFDYLEETYGKIRILEEKMMGRSRADVVMVHFIWRGSSSDPEYPDRLCEPVSAVADEGCDIAFRSL